MKLIFERSRPGRGNDLLPSLDVPAAPLPEKYRRKTVPRLPELGESDLSRHYQALARRAFGVCDGFYPLGSCTMKYNPKLGEEAAALPGFTGLHPLQPAHTVQGAQAVLARAEHLLCEITGMDAVTLQPAAGAHGEFLGLLLIKAYHHSQGDTGRQARRRWRRWAFSSGERGSSTVSTPPMPTTSPYWTGAEPSTGLPFTVTPPLEPRS